MGGAETEMQGCVLESVGDSLSKAPGWLEVANQAGNQGENCETEAMPRILYRIKRVILIEAKRSTIHACFSFGV